MTAYTICSLKTSSGDMMRCIQKLVARAKDPYLATYPKGHFLRKDRAPTVGREEPRLYSLPLLDVSTGDCPLMIPSGPRGDRGPSLAPWLRPWPRGPIRLWGWLCAVLWATVALVVRSPAPAPADSPGSRLPAPAPGPRPPGPRPPAPGSRPILPAPGRSSPAPGSRSPAPGRFFRPRPILPAPGPPADPPGSRPPAVPAPGSRANSADFARLIGIFGHNSIVETASCRGFSVVTVGRRANP